AEIEVERGLARLEHERGTQLGLGIVETPERAQDARQRHARFRRAWPQLQRSSQALLGGGEIAELALAEREVLQELRIARHAARRALQRRERIGEAVLRAQRDAEQFVG